MSIVFELLLLTILPSLFLLIYFIKTDKYPEPTPILIKTFTLGILICFPAGYLNYLIIKIKQNRKFIFYFGIKFFEIHAEIIVLNCFEFSSHISSSIFFSIGSTFLISLSNQIICLKACHTKSALDFS